MLRAKDNKLLTESGAGTGMGELLCRLSQRYPPILPVAQARFLQIEVALDPPPDLVGDLAVAQQQVDEFALR